MRVDRYRLIAWVYRKPFWQLLVLAFAAYVVIGLGFAFLYGILQEWLGLQVMTRSTGSALMSAMDYVYFSFVTQATIGYGDLSAVGIGRLLCPLQAIIGLFATSMIIPLVIVKIWAPQDAIIFAEQAELVRRTIDGRPLAFFGFRCINTHAIFLSNVRITCFLKIDQPRDMFGTRNLEISIVPHELPYMGTSPWYFHTSDIEHLEAAKRLGELLAPAASFSFKVLITGTYAGAEHASLHVYPMTQLVDGAYDYGIDVPDGSRDYDHRFNAVTKGHLSPGAEKLCEMAGR